MRKFITLLTMAMATLAILAAAPSVMAGESVGNTKIWICHSTSLISDGELYTAISGSLIPAGETVGQLIRVAAPSIPAHCWHFDRVFDFTGAPFTPVYGLCRPDAGLGIYDVPCGNGED